MVHRRVEEVGPPRFSGRDLEAVKQGFAKRLNQVIEETYGPRGGSKFARDVGVPDQTMRPWLGGRTIPSGEKLAAISLVTERSIDWLLFGKEGSQLSWDEEQWLQYYRELKGNDEVTKLLYQIIKLAREGQLGTTHQPSRRPRGDTPQK